MLKKIKKKLRKINKYHTFDKYVSPLLNPEVLDRKIAHIKNIAASDDSAKEYTTICRKRTNSGLCSYILVHFTCLAYSLAIGKIPVIDMQSYMSPYMEKDKLGKENAWEYYFKQPCGCGLSSVKQGVELSWGDVIGGNSLPHTPTGSEANFDRILQTWQTIYRNFFILNDATKKYIDEEYNRLIKPGMRVLGVNCRGADYNPITAPAHPIQPDTDTLIAKVKDAMTEWKCDYVFLATPEKKSYDIFDKHFPGRVLRCAGVDYDSAVDFSKNFITTAVFDRPNDKYLQGLEYLSSVVILSRCTSAVLGITSGSTVARYINDGKYENVYAFDLGFYPNR